MSDYDLGGTRTMTKALEVAVDSLTASQRRVLSKVFLQMADETPREHMTSLYRGLAVELFVTAKREDESFGWLASNALEPDDPSEVPPLPTPPDGDTLHLDFHTGEPL